MGTENTIALILQAHDEASAQLAKAMDTIARSSGQLRGQLGPVSQEAAKVDTNLAQATRTIRVLSGGLLQELSPALGQTVSATSAAASATRSLPLAWSAAAVAAVAVTSVLAQYTSRLFEAQQRQADLNLAVRAFDVSAMTGQLEAIAKAQELYRVQVQESKKEIKSLRDAWDVVVSWWKATLGPAQETLTQDQKKVSEAIVGALPVERAIRMAEATMREAQARRGLLQVLVEQADLEANEPRVLALRQQIAQTISNEASAEETRLRKRAEQRAEQLRAIGAPAEAVQLIFDELDKDISRLSAEAGAKFDALMLSMRQRVLEIRERRLLPSADLSEVERFERPLTPAEIERARQAVLSADQREVALAHDRVALLREQEGLTASQRAAIELQVIEAERLVQVQAAQGHEGRKNLATLEATIRSQSVLRQELERTDFGAGFRRGLRDTQEELESWGRAGQQVVRDFASNSQRFFSDLLFTPIEKGWKKTLEEVPRQLAMSTLRQLTDLFGQFATSQLFRGLGVTSLAAALSFGGGGGGGGQIVTAAQAQALQAAGIPVGLSSTGQFVVTGAGAGAGPTAGGFQIPGLPFGALPQPGFLQNFLATPIAGGALAGTFAAPAGGALAMEAAALGIGAGGLGPAGFTFGQALGAAGGALGLGFTIFSALQGPPTAMNIVTSGVSGALSGALLGSAIFPGPGTVVGAIAGAILGGGAAAFGKGGGQQKKRDIRGISRAEGLAAAGAFQSALRGATTLEDLVRVLNASYAPHPPRQWTVAATRSDGSQIRTGLFIIGQGPQWGFTLDDLFDPSVIDTLEIIAGEHGAEEQQPGLVEETKAKIDELMRERAQIAVTAGELVPGGLLRETTVPATLVRRLRGRQLTVDAATLAGMDDDARVRFLRELAKDDYDQSLGILWREPDTGEAVSLTTFIG